MGGDRSRRARQPQLGPIEWEQARIEVLEALGRADEAQAFRWERFNEMLNAVHLRDYLRKLPDFQDFDAEQRGLTHALGYGEVHQALGFFVAWPDLERAKGFEPSTPTLARLCSTTELRPLTASRPPCGGRGGGL